MLASGRARWLAFITNKRVSAHDGYEAIIGSNVVGLGALVAWFVYRTTTPDTQHKYNNHADKFIRPRIPLCMYAHPYRHLYIQKEQFKYYGFLTRSTPNAVNPVFCLLYFHSDSQFRWLRHWLVLVKMAVSDLNRRGTAWLGMLLSWIITQPLLMLLNGMYCLSIVMPFAACVSDFHFCVVFVWHHFQPATIIGFAKWFPDYRRTFANDVYPTREPSKKPARV